MVANMTESIQRIQEEITKHDYQMYDKIQSNIANGVQYQIIQ